MIFGVIRYRNAAEDANAASEKPNEPSQERLFSERPLTQRIAVSG